MRMVTELDRIVAAAVEEARTLGIAVSVAVVDRGGRLKRFTRMDGAEIAGEVLAEAPEAARPSAGQPTARPWCRYGVMFRMARSTYSSFSPTGAT
jgi:hypothetical protein